jgi:hypothetical protein
VAKKKDDKRGKNPGSATTQFKEGAPSANPKGRPKGSPNRHAIIRKVLGQVVTADVAGRKKRIPVTEASLLRLSQMALKGDLRAIHSILALWQETEDALEAEREAQYPFSDADRQVIEAIYERMSASE